MNLAQLQPKQTSHLDAGIPGFGQNHAQVSTMVVHAPMAHVTAAPQPLVAQGRLRRAVARLPLVWMARMKQRRALMRLDDRLLSDVGLSRSDALEEYNKPFWRP